MLQNINVFTLQINHTTVEFVVNHLHEKNDLTRHMFIHTRVKKHGCENCENGLH